MKNSANPSRGYQSARWLIAALCLLSVAAATAMPSRAVRAQASPGGVLGPTATLLSYQGHLLDEAGEPVDGSVDMTFRLYREAEGGSPFWAEAHTGSDAVEVSNGLFHVTLGSLTPLDPAAVTGDLYLELEVAGDTLAPRELLTSVAYAVEASTVPDSSVTAAKLYIDDTVHLHQNMLKSGYLWPASYDSRGSQFGLPGFLDTLYYATARGLTVEANRAPDGGSLDNMFNLHPNSFARWVDVGPANPVEVTIGYSGDGPLLNGVLLAFGFRSSHAIDYTLEYYYDGDDDGTYVWEVVADVEGNDEYQVYHPVSHWRVQKIRLTVTAAGDGTEAGRLAIATIQAPSSNEGKRTGPMLDVAGDRMYGDLDMGGNNITNVNDFYAQEGTANLEVANGYGNLRLRAGGSLQAFIDTDNDSEDAAFRLGKDNHYFGGAYQEVFKVDETGLVTIHGNISSPINTGLTIDAGNGSIEWLTLHDHVHVTGDMQLDGSCVGGAYVEANLQTEDEREAGAADRFEEGDVLCWGIDQLEICSQVDDRLVQAVADSQGRPIVMGAEVIKVLGPVQRGDILVASDSPGYAMVNNDPPTGAIIAQALEDFSGERGRIKAMIRKF